MATKLICDGCGAVLFVVGENSVGTGILEAKELTVRGERTTMRIDGGLPEGEFHWCMRCAKVAFEAVKDAAFQTVTDAMRPC
jgi:hypothetical protein